MSGAGATPFPESVSGGECPPPRIRPWLPTMGFMPIYPPGSDRTIFPHSYFFYVCIDLRKNKRIEKTKFLSLKSKNISFRNIQYNPPPQKKKNVSKKIYRIFIFSVTDDLSFTV